jgi:hypothetical protein
MVMAGSSLLVAVNGFGAGFTEFFNKQFNNLAPNILFISSAQQDSEDDSPVGGTTQPFAKNYVKSSCSKQNQIIAFCHRSYTIVSGRCHYRIPR